LEMETLKAALEKLLGLTQPITKAAKSEKPS